MYHARELDIVRQIVRSTLETFHGPLAEEIYEKILIRAGYYCGRCFSCEGFRAVWFMEECQVKFYGPDGGFLRACSTSQRSNLDVGCQTVAARHAA